MGDRPLIPPKPGSERESTRNISGSASASVSPFNHETEQASMSRNPVAKALADPKFKQKVVKLEKGKGVL
jgi:hypothetical protein